MGFHSDLKVIYKDSNGKEIARKKRTKGRPPCGPHVKFDTDGNIIVGDCLTSAPLTKAGSYRKICVGGVTLWHIRGNLLNSSQPVQSVSEYDVDDEQDGDTLNFLNDPSLESHTIYEPEEADEDAAFEQSVVEHYLDSHGM